MSDRSARCPAPGARTLERRRTVGGPPWQLPVALLVLAVLAHLAGVAGLLLAADDLAAGLLYGPAQLGVAHLEGLGLLTVAIVGALFQLVPVILRQQVAGPRMGAVLGGGLVAGSWSLAAGLWSNHDAATALGGTLLVAAGAGIVALLVHALARAFRGGTFGPAGAGIALATWWLSVVLALGAVMAANRVHPFLEVDRLRLIGAHGTIAMLGWVGGAVIAVSMRLAPMFTLAHGAPSRPAVVALALWHLGVAQAAAGIGLHLDPLAALGGASLLAAVAAEAVFVAGVVRRRRRRLEAPALHLALGLVSTAGAAVLMLGAWAGPWDPFRAATVATLLVLLGLGVGVTSGHLFKVVPMLVWTGRYAPLAGASPVPRLTDLYPAPLATLEVALFAAGLGTLAGGVAAGSAAAATAGAALLALAGLAVAAAVGWVLTRGASARPLGSLGPAPTAVRGLS
jgi:hypothetical protein